MPGSPRMLLLSRWLDAVPAFVDAHVRPGHSAPTIGFVPTASAIYPDHAWVDLDRTTLRGFGYPVIDIPLDTLPADEVTARIDDVDALFVSGGNVFHLLYVLRSTGLDIALAERIRAGLPYLGASAGACIVGSDIAPLHLLDDSAETAPLDSTLGLGIIDVVPVPHADGKVGGTAAVDELRRRYSSTHDLRFLDDDQALEVIGTTIRTVRSG